METTKETGIAAALTQFEAKFDLTAAQWKREYLSARRARTQFKAIAVALGELGRAIHGDDPAQAKVVFDCAERLGASCRRLDVEMAIVLAAAGCRELILANRARKSLAAPPSYGARRSTLPCSPSSSSKPKPQMEQPPPPRGSPMQRRRSPERGSSSWKRDAGLPSRRLMKLKRRSKPLRPP